MEIKSCAYRFFPLPFDFKWSRYVRHFDHVKWKKYIQTCNNMYWHGDRRQWRYCGCILACQIRIHCNIEGTTRHSAWMVWAITTNIISGTVYNKKSSAKIIYFRGVCHAFCYPSNANNWTRINRTTKLCYFRLFLSTETVSWRLLQRMARITPRINTDWDNVGLTFWIFFFFFLRYACKNHPKNCDG